MHPKVRIDHLLFGASKNLRVLLDDYAELGFRVSPYEETMRHHPGLRTGFLYFSPHDALDYIEFLTVEEREIFEAAKGDDPEIEFTEGSFVQGVGVRIDDADALHAVLTKQGTAVKPLLSKRPEGQGDDGPPRWRFVELESPAAKLGSFYVQYLNPRPVGEPGVSDGGNGIYAMGGVLYDHDNAAHLETLLRHDFPQSLVRRNGEELFLGCHRVMARSFQQFQEDAGIQIERSPLIDVYGALLYTESLEATEAELRGKWKPLRRVGDELLLLPTEKEGLLGLVRQKPISEWRAERPAADWLF